VPDVKLRPAFLCGPTAMMDSVTEALTSLSFPLQNLHTESFFF
jgi:ferredoxin-NADP reductase